MTNPRVVVPDWQRSYSWTISEVETFWKDLLDFNARYPQDNIRGEEYFLGSVVVVEGGSDYLLLDGQQRIATSAILLSVIRDFLVRYNNDAAVRISARYLTDYDDALATTAYKLTLNRYDRDFFRREVLEWREANYEAPQPGMESHRLIRKAREYFTSKFEEKYGQLNNPLASFQWALRIQNVLTTHVSVVAVFSNDEDNAATVFETLNDRGIGLSTPDLLRNLILRRAVDRDREEIIGLWQQILQLDGDINIKQFLRHYWISHNGDVKTQSLYREIKGSLIANDTNSLTFSRQLADSSNTYRDIVTGNDQNDEISRLLKDLNDLDAAQFYPTILSAFEISDEPEMLIQFLKAVVVVYVRHSVIGKLEGSFLENFAFSLAKRIRDNRNIQAALQELRAFAPNDDSFKAAFETAHVSRVANARYILRELEHHERETEELEVAPPSRVHVEHIYPQTPLPGQRWANHSQAINRLGNLTLLSRRLNTAIRNAAFLQKRPCYQHSEILITRELVDFEEWNFDAIEERQSEMSEDVCNIWPLPTVPATATPDPVRPATPPPANNNQEQRGLL